MNAFTDTENSLGHVPRLQFGFDEAAKALGVPKSTLELECRRGRGPQFFTVGRRKFTTIELIRQWQAGKIAEAQAERAPA